jgi:Protein of unknown function (DUF3435)
MGHHGNTYEEFYMPDLIERDFQSIYFGTPPQDDLIRSVARMGLSRDMRAPTSLTDEQKSEVTNHPDLVKLRDKRKRYKKKIYDHGYYPLSAAKGTHLYDRYKEYDRKANSKANTLRIQRRKQAIRDFHDTIDEIEINRQLDGIPIPEILTRPVTQYELRERASIVSLMSLSLNELDEEQALKIRIKFVYKLSRLCHRQESRWFSPCRRIPTQACGEKRAVSYVDNAKAPKRLRLSVPEPNDSLSPQALENVEENGDVDSASIKVEDVEALQDSYPIAFTYPVCLICIGDERFSYEERIRPFARKDSLQRHINLHVKNGEFDQRMECNHPNCSDWLDNVQHFMSHAARIHGVFH